MTVEDDRVQQLIELETENTELRETVSRLTRERDQAQAHADSKALAALQVMTWDTDLTHLHLLVKPTPGEDGIELKPMVLNSDQVVGIFEALKTRFEKHRDLSPLKRAEQAEHDATRRLHAEGDNRDNWQEKAEAAEAKMEALANMVQGVSLMEVTLETCEQIQGVMARMIEVTQDADDLVVNRCACWYRARLTEMRRQLHIAVASATEDKLKVAASFAPELARLLDVVESMDRANHLSLLGVIPGGGTAVAGAQSVAPDGVDETPNDSLDSSAQPSAESDKNRGQGASEKGNDV